MRRFDAENPEDVARAYALGLCRDVVITPVGDPGETGLLCETRDGQDHAGDAQSP